MMQQRGPWFVNRWLAMFCILGAMSVISLFMDFYGKRFVLELFVVAFLLLVAAPYLLRLLVSVKRIFQPSQTQPKETKHEKEQAYQIVSSSSDHESSES